MMEKNCVVRGRPSPDSKDMYIKTIGDKLTFVDTVEEATKFTGDDANLIRKFNLMWQGVVVNKDTGELV